MKNKYFIEKNGEWIATTHKKAIKEQMYGIRDNDSGHVLAHHLDCEEIGCPICNTEICLICEGVEGSITTHCYGEELTNQQREQIQTGKLDSLFKQWVKDAVSESTTFSLKTYLHNQDVIYRHFRKDIEEQTSLGKEVKDHVQHWLTFWINLNTEYGAEFSKKYS